MTKIFIEAKNKNTSEYHFVRTIISRNFPNVEVEFFFMDGIGNLFNETIVNQIRLAYEDGNRVIVLTDADTAEKGWGYLKRKAEIEKGMASHELSFPYFIYPNNHDDGDVETLMENAVRHDLHATFFDCFEDYERCISGVKDECGKPKYNIPDRKGKLHTYMTAQKLPRKLRNKFGSGDWLFDNPDYWNLNADALMPLKEFLGKWLV